MSVLNKPYELSVWEDVVNDEGTIVERKLCIIGAHNLQSQSRALQPKLVSNINGTNTFSFQIYYRYKDTVTGEEVNNPFAQYLTNERKLKLHYDDKWYDFIIKSVKIDSTKYTYEVTATDQYINELSKNGYNVTFDAELRNNLGSIQELATETLKETDWIVPQVNSSDPDYPGRISEFISDRSKENLVDLILTQSIQAHQIIDSGYHGQILVSDVTLNQNTHILAFYSCCKSENPRFSFIDATTINSFEKDDERVITNKDVQYYVDLADITQAIYEYDDNIGISIPSFCTLTPSVSFINEDFRGARYVWSPNVKFNTTLNAYVTEYTNDNDERGYGFTKTTYEAPNFIQNWITNPNGFKSTAGWNSAILTNGSKRGTLKAEAVRSNNANITLIDDLKSGAFNHTYTGTYDPILTLSESQGDVVLSNTGFYDNRINIGTLENGTTYIIKIKSNQNNNIRIRVGQYDFNPTSHLYTITNTFLDTHGVSYSDQGSYRQFVVTVQNCTLTPNQYKKQSAGKVVAILSGVTNGLKLYDFQIYEGVPKAGGGWLTPEDQLTDVQLINTTYIYDADAIDEATVAQTIDDFNPIWHGTEDPSTAGWTAPQACYKRRSITIKESNYYNIIQTLCETFECWAEFYIKHDVDGSILSKTLWFHNYTGDYNWAGFRYGVNLKSVQRSDDSKQIVTKLIVKQNTNEFGQNGFCTIARAPSNETGETSIYNIDYYINQGLLNAADWNTMIYDPADAEGRDIDSEDTRTNSNGYYVRLANINKRLEWYNEALLTRAVSLAKAEANLSLQTNGLASAVDSLESASDSFYAMFGYDYTNIPASEANNTHSILNENIGYLIKCAEFKMAEDTYTTGKAAAQQQYDALYNEYKQLEESAELWRQYKTELNKAFYSKFYRYIQEGTWTSQDYYDDEQYYLDAQSTLYNSSVPKVTYSISVLELSQLVGYEDFTFKIGDRTYVEDPEFFGYDDNGAPIREQIVLSEITYFLDQPEKNAIKVQNYKSQFQDLFKKITATVQSVQYSTGAYDKAAALADANDTEKSKFLQGGLNDAGTILQNLADQTVRLDAEGLTILDGLEVNRMLRAVSGGILLSNDGGNTWQLGITADGINASIINTGTLNTGSINIMYGERPTFRWDAYGLTAYDFTISNDAIYQIEPSKGVRFDHLGIYGFNVPYYIRDGETRLDDWRPTGIVSWDPSTGQAITTDPSYIRCYSTFELTKEGLYLNLGRGRTYYDFYRSEGGMGTFAEPRYHESQSALGKLENLIYNKWVNSTPYYDSTSQETEFVKIMSIGYNNSENLAIYDDGTILAKRLHIGGPIIYNDGSGLIKSVYSVERLDPPSPGTPWGPMPPTSATAWHKNLSSNDWYYCTTYDNGATWVGPYVLSQKQVDSSEYQYGLSDNSTTLPSSWTNNRATIDDSLPSNQGKYVFTQTRYKYYDNSWSAWTTINIERIAVDGSSAAATIYFDLDNEFDSCVCDTNGAPFSSDWSSTFTATVYSGATLASANWTIRAAVENSGAYLDRNGTAVSNIEVTNCNTATFTVGHITQSTPDTVHITVTASRTGGATYTAVYTFAKLLQGEVGPQGSNGAAGRDGVFIRLTADAGSIKGTPIEENPVYSPSTITITVPKTTGTTTSNIAFKYKYQYDEDGWSNLLPAGTASTSYTLTIDTSTQHNWLTIQAYSTNGTTLYDVEKIPIVHDGADGENVYALSLSEDSVSYGTGPDPDPNTSITVSNITTIITAYYGNQVITPNAYSTSVPQGSSAPEYTIVYAPDSKVTLGTRSGAAFPVTAFKPDRGTVHFSLYHFETKVAETVFEIIAQKQGEKGEQWRLTFNPTDEIIRDATGAYHYGSGSATYLMITAEKLSVSGTVTTQPVYWRLNGSNILPASGSGSANLYVKIDGDQWKVATNSSFTSALTPTLTDTAIISAYLDSSGTYSFDQEVITVVKDGLKGDKGDKGDPGADGAPGAAGANGLNSATVYIYKRSATEPSSSDKPTGALTYTFSTHDLTGASSDFNGWVAQPINTTGSATLWVRAATAVSSDSYDDIPPSEWVGPIQWEGPQGEQGIQGLQGDAGLDGLNQATLYIYKRSATEPTKPANYEYSFLSGSVLISGWSQTIPETNGLPCYVCSGVALSRDDTAWVTWSNPARFLEDGASPCVLTLSQDHISVAVDYNAATQSIVTPLTATIAVNAFEAGAQKTYTFTNTEPTTSNTGFYVYYIVSSTLTYTASPTYPNFVLTSLTGDQGTVTFALYKDGVLLDTQVCTVSGSVGGVPGTIYDVTFPIGDTLVETDNGIPQTPIMARAVARCGTEAATYPDVFWTFASVNLNSTAQNTVYLKSNGTVWTYSLNNGTTYTATNVSIATGDFVLTAYTSNSRTAQDYFDAESITVVPRGETGDSGDHGTDAEIQDIYYRSTSLTAPAKYTTSWVSISTDVSSTWTTLDLNGTSNYKYVYKATQTCEVTYTNNTSTSTNITCTAPTLYKAWHDDSNLVEQIAYATFIRTTNNGKTNALYFSDGTDGATAGRLYINAQYIQSGVIDTNRLNVSGIITAGQANIETIITNKVTANYINALNITAKKIEVKNGSYTQFLADTTNTTVRIGGWQVNESRIYGGSSSGNYVGICSGENNASYADYSFYAGATSGTNGSSGKFYVKKDGTLHATKGDIGGWEINASKLYHPHNSGYDGMGFIVPDSSATRFDSVWQDNVTSPVVFYAGANSDTPNPILSTLTRFVVLQDGSVYAGGLSADDAKITGVITAKNLSLTGTMEFETPQSLSISELETVSLATSGIGDVTFTFSKPDAGCTGNGYRASFQYTPTWSSSNEIGVLTTQVQMKVYAKIITDGSTDTTWTSVRTFTIRAGTTLTKGKAITMSWTGQGLIFDIDDYTQASFPASATNIDVAPTQRYTSRTRTITGGVSFSRPGILCSDHFLPSVQSTSSSTGYTLGDSTHRWRQLYAQTSTISTSDLRYKKDVTNLADQYDVFFNNLEPIKYKFINGTANRFHIGFIAQSVATALSLAHLTPLDFAGYCYDTAEDNTDIYGLRYEEFIALNTWQIQKLKTRLNTLEARIAELEARLNETE